MYRKFGKRLFDIIFSVIGIIIFFIIFIFIAPAIWIEDRGPIFYNAYRLGKNGKRFKMLKFRSMKVNAQDIRNKDGSTYNGDNDKRLTRIGRLIRKTSIDEIPQFINVLKGDMSIVGPRPYIISDDKDYNSLPKEKKYRQKVRPGITGYSQAYYRNSIPSDEKLKNDIYYVDNISFILDIKIILKTIVSVVKKENVFVDKNNKE